MSSRIDRLFVASCGHSPWSQPVVTSSVVSSWVGCLLRLGFMPCRICGQFGHNSKTHKKYRKANVVPIGSSVSAFSSPIGSDTSTYVVPLDPINDEIDEDYQCSVCLQLLCPPVIQSCISNGHLICHGCYTELQKNDCDTCPMCRDPFPPMVVRNRKFEQHVLEQMFPCIYCFNGCGATMPYSEWMSHDNLDCPMQYVWSPFISDTRMRVQHLHAHMTTFAYAFHELPDAPSVLRSQRYFWTMDESINWNDFQINDMFNVVRTHFLVIAFLDKYSHEVLSIAMLSTIDASNTVHVRFVHAKKQYILHLHFAANKVDCPALKQTTIDIVSAPMPINGQAMNMIVNQMPSIILNDFNGDQYYERSLKMEIASM